MIVLSANVSMNFEELAATTNPRTGDISEIFNIEVSCFYLYFLFNDLIEHTVGLGLKTKCLIKPKYLTLSPHSVTVDLSVKPAFR